MGTRSLTKIIKDNKPLTTIYRQFDGYPECMGMEIATFLKGKKIVNGFGSNDGFNCNGMGCLAAQLIKELKDGIGNIYIYPPDAEDCWEDYIYTISDVGGNPWITCQEMYGDNDIIFSGTPEEFIEQYKED